MTLLLPGHIDMRTFKSAVRKGAKLPADTIVHKAMSVLIEPGDGERQKKFTISTGAVDRDNDTISVKGWKLDNYTRSPVVFYNHETYMFPIGKTVQIGIEKNALVATVEFVPASVPGGAGENAETVFQLVDGGFLCAASVGFMPLEYATAKDRMDDDDWWPALDFTSQELMEWSIVTIPANPEATLDERSLILSAAKSAEEIAAEAASAAAALEAAQQNETLRRRIRAACL
jgi:phage head maturation protease